MKQPTRRDGMVVYAANGDGYHESELQDLIDTPRLRWVKVEAGCELPQNDEDVLVACVTGFEKAQYYANGFHSLDDDSRWLIDATHWARVELPR